MPAAIQAFNSQGQLTFSSESQCYSYIGLATYVSSVQPTINEAGYSTYTVNHAGQIAAGFLLPLSGSTAIRIRSMTQSGSTWTIVVQRGGGSVNGQGFLTEAGSFPLWIWGTPVNVSNFGLVTYSASGQVTADLAQFGMYFAGRADFGVNAESAVWTTVAGFESLLGGQIYPVCVTTAAGVKTVATGNGMGGIYYDRQYAPRFWRSGSTVYRHFAQENSYQQYEPEPIPYSESSYLPAQSIFLIDGWRFAAF